jgi:hypothetical protein
MKFARQMSDSETPRIFKANGQASVLQKHLWKKDAARVQFGFKNHLENYSARSA